MTFHHHNIIIESALKLEIQTMPTVNVNKPRILIVEDERDLLDILIELLPLYGLASDAASTADEALKLLAQNNYGGALIDLGLPGMSGFELVKMIRSQDATRNLACVAMTAWHSPDFRRDALAAGFNAYFAKPFVPDTVVHELRFAMSLAGSF